MPVDRPGVWLITIAIILIGAYLFFTLGRPERERREAAGGIALGAPAESATRAIGRPPLVCPGAPLTHLGRSFPEGWAQAAIDVALEELEARTAERWVYPIGRNATASCDGRQERTEVGIAADGTILWVLPVLGSTSLEVPPTLTPSGATVTN